MNGALTKCKIHLQRSALLVGLSLVVGVALGAADLLLSPRILANREAETTARIPDLVPGTVYSQRKQTASGEIHAAYNAANELTGWVLPVTGRGFAGPIELLLGLTPDFKDVTGVYILAQSETPGLGSRITLPAWLSGFTSKPETGRYRLGHEIDGLSGATISSAAVVTAVNTALDTLPDLEIPR
jgi:electron transport complex protein RnfG